MSKSTSALDELDRQILTLLKEDASQSYKDIADVVGKTEATVRRRVKRMKEQDFIKKFTVVLNDSKIANKKVKATIKIVPELQASKAISKKITDLGIVSEAYLLSGECGILLKVASNSIEMLTEFIENELGSIQGIKSLETCFIMKTLKEEY